MNLADISAGCRFIRAVEFKVSTGDDERTTLVSSVSSEDTYRRDLLDRDISESSVIERGYFWFRRDPSRRLDGFRTRPIRY